VAITTCTVPGKVALTFDDGPYLYTSALLDTLKAAGVNATFFVVAVNGAKGEIDLPASGYTPIIQRMVREGHQVGSHTWSHQNLPTLSQQDKMNQIIRNEIALTNILGAIPTYMRPPYASTDQPTLDMLKNLGYHVINYNLDTNDWKGDYNVAKSTFLTALQSTKPASSSYISLSHDIYNQTVTDLVPYMISNLRQLGYTTATVGECLGDPKQNWYRDPTQGTAVGNVSSIVNKAAGTASAKAPTATGDESSFGGMATPTPSTKLPKSMGTTVTPMSFVALVSAIVFGLAMC
jgi:peptidoglycan/xylan/chitin deacetylase (PgdA/CDA1 family)